LAPFKPSHHGACGYFAWPTHDFPQVGKVTVSIGYAALESQVLPIQTMEKSDRALYYAKDHGRNRVCNFDQLLAEGELEGLHQDGSIELF
jgi:GGDEF domain-containing protein